MSNKIMNISLIAEYIINQIHDSLKLFDYLDEYKKIQKSLIDAIKKINIPEVKEEAARNLLERGIYPYVGFPLYILSNNDNVFDKEMENKIFNIIEKDMMEVKELIIEEYNEYIDDILKIYELYKNKNYKLCILLLLNTISIITNDNFGQFDFTDRNFKTEMRKRANNNSEWYLELLPYKYADSNNIIKSYMRQKEKYKEYKFNRNAIIRGYVKNYDTRENCLRYFTVLYNIINIASAKKNNIYEENGLNKK